MSEEPVVAHFKYSRKKSSNSGSHAKVSSHNNSNRPSMLSSDPKEAYLLKQIASIKRQQDGKNKEMLEKYLQDNDISDLVRPYISDPIQINLLNYILGSENVNQMQQVAALAYTGVINNNCPPPNAPHRTEAYINPQTNKLECRAPIKDYSKRASAKGKELMCPNSSDPLAVEKYIDFFGNAHCQRPVLSGDFQCPTAENPTRTKRVVLKDNVGICVEDPMLKSARNNTQMGDRLVFTEDVNEKIVDYIDVISLNFNAVQIQKMKAYLEKVNSVGDLMQGLISDPDYEYFVRLASKHIKTDKDLSLAKLALLELNKGTSAVNIDVNSMLNMSGIDMSFIKK